jgi:hypothetical protein
MTGFRKLTNKRKYEKNDTLFSGKKKARNKAGYMSMEGRYVATVWNVVATMSMEGRYVATVWNVVATV